MGKADQNATLNLIVLGLGPPWFEKFVDFMIIFIDFSTQHNFVNRKRPIVHVKKAMVEVSSVRDISVRVRVPTHAKLFFVGKLTRTPH